MAQKAHPGAVPVPASSLSAEQTACLSTSEATPRRYRSTLISWHGFFLIRLNVQWKIINVLKFGSLLSCSVKTVYHVLQEILDELMDQ